MKARLIMVHDKEPYMAATLADTITKFIRDPQVVVLDYNRVPHIIIDIIHGHSNWELTRMFPFAEMTNEEAVSSVRIFLEQLIGPAYAAIIPTNHFYKYCRQSDKGSIALVQGSFQPIHIAEFSKSFNIWHVFTNETDYLSFPGKDTKFLVRDNREAKQFVQEVAGGLINVQRP